MSEANRSEEERAYATEWFTGETRVIRRGDTFTAEFQSGTRQVSFEITEQQADQLRFLWL